VVSRTRLAIVGLGMAVTPHARGLVDLADKIEVAHAFSPSAARRDAFSERFDYPTCDSLDTILNDETNVSIWVLPPEAFRNRHSHCT
jgi:UDP-N-acetyl-2-amino-2-deoxyglucuronate dehydrogenase